MLIVSPRNEINPMSDNALEMLLMRIALSTEGSKSGLADFLRDPSNKTTDLVFSEEFLAGRDIRSVVVEAMMDRPSMHDFLASGGPGMDFSAEDQRIIRASMDTVLDEKYLDSNKNPELLFKELLEKNESLLASGAEGPVLERNIAAMTRLFDAHGKELIEHYSSSGGPESETLARFYAATTLNPQTANVDIGDGRTVADVVNAKTGEALETYFGQARDAETATDRDKALRHIAHIDAAVTAGTTLAFDRHEEQLAQDADSRAAFAKLATDLIGRIPVVGGVKDLPGFDEVLGHVSSAFDASENETPNLTFARKFHDALADRVQVIEGEWNDPGLLNRWKSDRREELLESVPNLELDRKYGDLAAAQTTGGQTQYAALDGRISIDSPLHSQNDRYASCFAACQRADLGLDPPATTTVAAALTAQSMADGLPRVDSVVQNRDATLLIGVMGNVEDPASKRSVLPRDVAMTQSVEASTQKVDTLIEQQNKFASTQPVPPERELAPRSVMV
jgi:hypothetical protein